MFGAWQAGAWRALAPHFQPDLVVGASVGSLNGYAIAAGWTPEDLCAWWRDPSVPGFANLPDTIQNLMSARRLEREFAVVVVDLLRMRPLTVPAAELTAAHLLASCAVPGAMLPQKIGHRWYIDGGLLNPLPVWAAVERGATYIVVLQALPEIPLPLLRPLVKGFRAVFGQHPPLPAGIQLTTLVPSTNLGSLRDALFWNAANIDRWIAQGVADAENISIYNCF